MGILVGLIFFFSALVPLNFLRSPELDGRQAQGFALRSDCETAMHQQPAESGWTAIRTTGKHGRLTDRFRFVPLEAEFGGVMQDENWPLFGRHPGLRRSKVPGEDEAFIHARVAEEAISGLRRRPILTGGGECFANLLANFAQHFAQPQLQALVGKLTPR